MKIHAPSQIAFRPRIQQREKGPVWSAAHQTRGTGTTGRTVDTNGRCHGLHGSGSIGARHASAVKPDHEFT